MAKLIGIYQIEKSRLNPTHCSDFHLVISRRHKASANKPADYLLLKQSGKFIYLSSLYAATGDLKQLQADLWHFEVKGTHYILRIDRSENQAEISLKKQEPKSRLLDAA